MHMYCDKITAAQVAELVEVAVSDSSISFLDAESEVFCVTYTLMSSLSVWTP